MVLRIDPSDATPIWSQIEEGIRRLVATGSWKPGGPVPSVRDLASELRINPATVARGYQRLTEAGILVVRRGEIAEVEGMAQHPVQPGLRTALAKTLEVRRIVVRRPPGARALSEHL